MISFFPFFYPFFSIREICVSNMEQRGLTPDGTRHSREPTKSIRKLLTLTGKPAPPMTEHGKMLACA